MSDQPNWYHQTFGGRYVPPGGPFNNHSNDEQERHRTRHPQPALHYATNNPRPHEYAQNTSERSSAPSSGRSQRSHPQHDELIAGYSGARATAASGSTSRQHVGSDSVHRSTGSNPRSSQGLPHHNAFYGGGSIANATTGSSSPSRHARDAPDRERSDRGSFQSQDYLTQVGTLFPSQIDIPAGFSVTGSPPPQPSSRLLYEDHSRLGRQEDDNRIARSEVYGRHGRMERYDRLDDHRPLRNRRDDLEPEHPRRLPHEERHRTHRQIPQEDHQNVTGQTHRRAPPQNRPRHDHHERRVYDSEEEEPQHHSSSRRRTHR